MMRIRRVIQIPVLVASGWFGEWSYLVSCGRVLEDTLRTGYLRSYPRIASFDWWYGINWRVNFEIGAPVQFHIVAGVLLVALIWFLIEFLKGAGKSSC